jgi:type II secretory pathway component PulF
VALTAVGETGACLDEIFQRTGKKYMELFKNQVGMLLTFLEPAIIVFLGIFIGFVVIAIMLAVVSVSDLYV